MKRTFKYFILIFSTFIFSFGFNVFLRPAGIAPGGITGFSLIVNYLFPVLPVGVLTLVFNLPLFLLGRKYIGGRFVVNSVVASVILSVLLDLHPLFPKIHTEPLLAAIFGGVIMGFSMGLAFIADGSTGGVDILIRVLRKKYPRLSIGQLLLVLDGVIVALSGIVFGDISRALYAMITMYTASIALDAVLYGPNYSKCALIITNRPTEVNNSILSALTRGTTLVPCRGGYSGDEKQIIVCAIKKGQLTALKEAVLEVDCNAFIIMCDATEVLGLGFNSHGKNAF